MSAPTIRDRLYEAPGPRTRRRIAVFTVLALIALASALSNFDDSLIDCQFETPHLKSMGGRHISYKEYMDILRASI